MHRAMVMVSFEKTKNVKTKKSTEFEEDGDNHKFDKVSERIEKRCEKWQAILRILDWRHKMKSNPQEVKKCIKLGVTNSMRTIV